MPVNSAHKDYDDRSEEWRRIRDVLAGTDSVKSQRSVYLPRPSGHSDADYSGYLTRAEFYSATARTVDGLTGAIFRKDPIIKVPSQIERIIDQATLRGSNLTTFSKRLVDEVISIGRYGVLVDTTTTGEDNLPYLSGYSAENIINWRQIFINRKPVLSMVVLREMGERQGDNDEFSTEEVERYRVLYLGVEEGDALKRLRYAVDIWEKQKSESGKEDFVKLETYLPTRRGEPLDHIPFFFFGPKTLEPDISKSPILDLVDTNLSHYRTSAELEEGAYFTGLPVYWFAGKFGGGNPPKFTVGSRSAFIMDEGGQAGVLSVSGEGMGLLRDLSDRKEKRMAVLGARILEDQKSGVEAADTVKMRHRGENSLLASIADTASRGMVKVLKEVGWWNGSDDVEVEFELNQDFVSNPMSPKEIVELTAALQQGSIGPSVFFNILKEGERIPNEWSEDDWMKDVQRGGDMFQEDLTNEESGDVIPLNRNEG